LTVSQVDDDEIPCILALKRFKRFKSGTRAGFEAHVRLRPVAIEIEAASTPRERGKNSALQMAKQYARNHLEYDCEFAG
jgi:hypothetical protein